MLYWCISDQILFCVHFILFISQHLLAFILENANLISNLEEFMQKLIKSTMHRLDVKQLIKLLLVIENGVLNEYLNKFILIQCLYMGGIGIHLNPVI